MSGDHAEPSVKIDWKIWWIPAAVSLGVFSYMFCFFPYNFGYSKEAYTLGENLWVRWQSEMWEHGKYVPIICAFIIYLKRHQLAVTPIVPTRWGIVMIVLSMLMYWVGYVVDVTYFSYFLMHFFIISLVVFFLGKEWFKQLLFPLAFLFFACPYDFLEAPITVPLRHFMAGAASLALNLLGIPVVKIGTGLVSASDPLLGLAEGARFQLDVADPCSGMRSLFALLMLSSLYGYLVLGKTWQRWILFLSAVPMAVAGNVVRIILLTFGTLFFGKDFAIGTLEKPSTYHMGAGIAVFIVAMTGVITVGYVLENFSSKLVPLFKRCWNELTILSQETSSKSDSLNNKDTY